ncbi:MAG: histidinol-phosphate transaminase [Acholeplasmatales bacterium]|nr:histidinol-phosphate transaminase [Acholeplasmatales bacterium]
MKYIKNSFKGLKPYHSSLITDGIILNANESPYNPPKVIIEEFKKEVEKIEFNRYPDMDERELCHSIAKRFNVNDNNVTIGVGSDELLDCVFRAVIDNGDKVVSFSPSFSMYKVFTELVGGEFVGVYGDDFKFNVDDMISSIKNNNPKLVLICLPNNPTGGFLSEKDVRRIIETTSGLVLLDLAYIDFSGYDYTNIALEYDNVISFRTFSKAMSLPSIRCGYAISRDFNIDMINSIKAPYSVTTMSQIMARIANDHFNLYKVQIDLIISERERLYNNLLNLGFKVYPSKANFIFVIMNDKYFDILLENKIYIRKFKENTYRITVGSQKENDTLIEVLKCAKQN